MSNGAGKYDNLCTKVREDAEAQGALVIVVEGNKGSGFSVQLPAEQLLTIPSMLRDMANKIEESQKSQLVN